MVVVVVVEVAVDQCLFVHKERQIDFGLYVDDIEASADDEQLQWLKDRFAERYEIKWLGFSENMNLVHHPHDSTQPGLYEYTHTLTNAQ